MTQWLDNCCVFPVRGKVPVTTFKDLTAGQKVPCGEGAMDYRSLVARYRAAGMNPAIATGQRSGLFAVDCDNQEAADWFEVHYIHGTKVQTGRGWHYYFLAPRFPVRNSRSELHPHIDIRGDGGYVVGPGAVHDSGREYELTDKGLGAPIGLISWEGLRQHATAERTAEDNAPVPIDVTTEEGKRRVALAIEYAGKAQPAISGAGGQEALWRVALHLMRKLELPIDAASTIVMEVYNPRCVPPWTPTEVMHKLEDARDRSTMATGVPPEGFLDLTPTTEAMAAAGGKLQKLSPADITQTLTTHPDWDGVFRFDVIARKPTAIHPPFPMRMTYGDFSDGDATGIQIWFEAQGFSVPFRDIRRVVEKVAELPTRSYNPVVEYLDALPPPSGPCELDHIHETILNSPDGPIASQIFKKQMVAAVRRIRAVPGLHDPPRPVDHRVVVVLDGPQNAGKTSLLRLLGGKWYASVKGDVHDKDTRIAIAGNWIVEMEEMASTKRSDRDAIKAFISAVEDNDRRAYGRSHEKVQRSFVLFGSSNELRFDDPTGHARFAPIRVGKMNQANAERLRDRFWAEANALALSDYSHYLTPEEAAWANERCLESEEDALCERLRRVLAGIPFVTIQEAYEMVMGIKANPVPNKSEQATYADSLRRIGCRKERMLRRAGWLVPKEIAEQPVLASVQQWLKADDVAGRIRARLTGEKADGKVA
jgi:predicted P-loop ATPase